MRRRGHAVADGQPLRRGADLLHHSGQLAARHERRRHGDLVGARDEEHVGEVDGGGADADAHLVRTDLGDRDVVHDDHLGGTVHPADGRPHGCAADG